MANTALKKITAAAKIYRRKHPSCSWTDAIKKVSKAYNTNKKLSAPAGVKKAAKKAVKKSVRKSPGIKKKAISKKPVSKKHTDTRSHNVNIRVGSVGITEKDFQRIDNDTNGNPRYVIHWTGIANTYAAALKIANKLGGRKYHNKKYGGGVVFQSYNIEATAKRLNDEIKSKKVGSTLWLEKGESARKKPSRIVQVRRTKAGTFKKFMSVSGLPAYNDAALAEDIILTADNDNQLYYSRKLPIQKNLAKKWKKGTFDLQKSALLWRNYVDEADKNYSKKFTSKKGKGFLLSVYDRKMLADAKAKEFFEGLKADEFNDL